MRSKRDYRENFNDRLMSWIIVFCHVFFSDNDDKIFQLRNAVGSRFVQMRYVRHWMARCTSVIFTFSYFPSPATQYDVDLRGCKNIFRTLEMMSRKELRTLSLLCAMIFTKNNFLNVSNRVIKLKQKGPKVFLFILSFAHTSHKPPTFYKMINSTNSFTWQF